MIEITKLHLRKIQNVCRAISSKTGVDVDDLFSECLSKVPNVQKNYNARMGKGFDAYLAASMRGYALNYCRDKSFLSSIGRTDLNLYSVSNRFPNLKIAAECMQVDYEKLRIMHQSIANLRAYASTDISKEWTLPTKPAIGSSTDILYTICTKREITLASRYMDNKPMTAEEKAIAESAIAKIKAHKDDFATV